MIILFLLILDIPYETYDTSKKLISTFVTPATVALAIKLEKNYVYLQKHYSAILMGIITGVILHTIMIFGFGFLFKYVIEMVWSLFPKSISTSIAVGVSESFCGI